MMIACQGTAKITRPGGQKHPVLTSDEHLEDMIIHLVVGSRNYLKQRSSQCRCECFEVTSLQPARQLGLLKVYKDLQLAGNRLSLFVRSVPETLSV